MQSGAIQAVREGFPVLADIVPSRCKIKL
jgi:hypothetical protein